MFMKIFLLESQEHHGIFVGGKEVAIKHVPRPAEALLFSLRLFPLKTRVRYQTVPLKSRSVMWPGTRMAVCVSPAIRPPVLSVGVSPEHECVKRIRHTPPQGLLVPLVSVTLPNTNKTNKINHTRRSRAAVMRRNGKSRLDQIS